MLLVVGLRNPGRDYRGTRHNVGEEVVRALAGPSRFSRAPQRIQAEVSSIDLGGRRSMLVLPVAFMNESGRVVAPLARYYKVPPHDIVLVHDDIDLPFGKLRFHFGRGTGGHNGVTSVLRSLSDPGVWRLKVGVGRPPGRMDPADFVLRHFYDRERPVVDLLVEEGAEVLRTFGADGGDAARRRAGEAAGRIGGDDGSEERSTTGE